MEGFEISTVPASNKIETTIPCDFGERILSRAIQIQPLRRKLLKPVVLILHHSIIELPELASIVIKTYDGERGEWITLSHSAG